jgi:hypothetical protein
VFRLNLAETPPYPLSDQVASPQQGIGDKFLFAAGKVVLQRTSWRIGLGHDLSHAGPRDALAADQIRRAPHHPLARRKVTTLRSSGYWRILQ